MSAGIEGAIAIGLRKCRVEDGTPVRLIDEADVFHITHMVSQEIRTHLAELLTEAREDVGRALEDSCLTHLGRDLGTIHRDDIAGAALGVVRARLGVGAGDE